MGSLDAGHPVFFLNGHIHEDTPFGPLGIGNTLHGLDPLVGDKIAHGVDNELALPIFFNDFGWFCDVRMAAKNQIRSPVHHLTVKGLLFLCRLQLVLHSHLGHHNCNIRLFFSLLNFGLHVFQIEVRQIASLFFRR